ncbi:MAG: EAL domain-containing protein [Nitrosomonadales bacterium]|nr:EAL domain-containing protein [Nitrosomonadales bacterium]
MNRIFASLIRRYTFQRQLGAMVTLGILFLALLSSLVGSWQGNERVRRNLLDQGQHITENLARQSTLALVYASADNATEAANVTMAFPGVVSVEIRDVGGHVLLTRGRIDPAEFLQHAERTDGLQAAAVLNAESSNAWHFSAPVYSQPAAGTPFTEEASPELLGQVSVVMSKDALYQMTSDVFKVNLTTSFSFALLFLFLIRVLTRRMTQPLNQLSVSMGRAQAGEPQVRALLDGPRDIAEMARAFNSMMTVQEQREAALRVAAIAFETEEGMMVTDAKSEIIQVNRAFTKLTGYSAEEVIGKTPVILRSGRQDEEFYRRMWAALRLESYWQGEIWDRRKNGEVYPELLTITAVVDADGAVTNYVGSFIDITERKHAEDQIHHLAFYDSLSQLPNRRLLFERLRHAIINNARNQTYGALLFIDLDNFKVLNDTKGHEFGDLLLVEVGRRLQSCVREGDTLARLGGDEFVVVLEGLSADREQAARQTRVIAEKMLHAINQPYQLNGIEQHSSSSLGITLFVDGKQKVDELLKQADTAMYEAKKSGRDTLRFFDPAMQEALEVRTQLEAGMRTALSRQEFRLYYQIQVDRSGHPVGAETLIRWLHPEQGLIAPDQFIPIAEETGLILTIGQWVLQAACAQIKEWERDPLMQSLSVAVNVSVRQFRHPDFVNQASEIIEHSGIRPELLKLELTESTVLENVADTIAKMEALNRIGVRFSMDDFGTGYSSLAYLTQLPFNQLKIDQSFVRNIGTKSSDAMIIQTIIGMANNLGMEVIAEGVETLAQRDFLEANGCRLYQGYLFSRPVPLTEFVALLQKGEFHPGT